MCMFCAAIPAVTAAGLILDTRQRQEAEKSGRPLSNLRPFPVITALAIPVLLVGAVFVHSRFSWMN
jgi:hypothetical protein